MDWLGGADIHSPHQVDTPHSIMEIIIIISRGLGSQSSQRPHEECPIITSNDDLRAQKGEMSHREEAGIQTQVIHQQSVD